MLGHSNTWPEAVLGRFNTVLTPPLADKSTTDTQVNAKDVLLVSPTAFLVSAQPWAGSQTF